MCSSDLKDMSEMNIRKDSLLRRVTASCSTEKNIIWSLDSVKAAGSYFNLLLVGSGQ